MLAAVLVAAGLLQASAAVQVTAVEPAVVPAYAPVEVSVRGSGFGPGCRVLLGAPGKLLEVPVEVVDGELIRVRLRLGLGPRPPRRLLVVRCDGVSTPPHELRVERQSPSATPAAAADPGVAASEPPVPAVMEGGEPPAIDRIDPPELAAWSTETLTVHGAGFAAGSLVKILANRNAGTSRPPLYEMVPFTAEVLSDTVLTVALDRGFAPVPRLRPVVVVNPDGGESAPVFLAVARRSP